MSKQDPEHIPIEIHGRQAYIDFTKPTIVHHRLSDESTFSEKCWETCDPTGLADFVGHQAAANFCMMNAMNGQGGEHIVEITVVCEGPKRRFLRGGVCRPKVRLSFVDLPFDETHPEEQLKNDPEI